MTLVTATVKDKTTVTASTNSVTVSGSSPVTEQINGVTIGTVASGGTNNQVIENSASTPIGTEANPSVIGDSQAQVNGVNTELIPATVTHDQQIHDSAGGSVGTAANPSVVSDATVTVNGDSLGATGSVVAEGSVDLVVNLDGSPSGSWDGDSWEVTSAPCADATVNVNGVFMENIPSGDTENIEVRQETGATLVGSKQGQHWRIDNSQAQVNGVNTETIPATVTHNQLIQDSAGASVGTEANPSVISDASVTVNSGAFDTVVAEGSIDVRVEYENGTPVGTINAGVVEIPNIISVSMSVSDDTPDFGDTITLTATPTNITPVSYLFFAWRSDTDEFKFLQESASNVCSWTTDVVNTWSVHVIADDGAGTFSADCKAITITSDTDAASWLNFVSIPDDGTMYFSGTAQEVTGSQYWYYVNQLVFDLKADSLWSQGYYMYLYIGGSASIHKINLFNPQDTDAAFRADFNGGWTHDANGITTNGTNTYADTHFNSATHLTVNDGAFVAYVRASQTGVITGFDWGAFETATNKAATWAAKVTANRSFYAMGVTEQVNGIAVSDLTGCHILTRDNNSALQKWIGNDGTVLNSDTTANIGHPPYTDYIGARNNDGSPLLYAESGTNYALIGRFDGLSDALSTSLRTRIDTFMEVLNLNV